MKYAYKTDRTEKRVGKKRPPAIGAPVFDHEGNVDAGINIPVFSNMASRQELVEHYVPLLLDTATKISAARGHMTGPLRKQKPSTIRGDQRNGRRKP